MGSNAHPKRVAKDPTQADGWGLLDITWHQLVIATSFGDRVEDSELKEMVKERKKGSFPQGLNILLQDLRGGELLMVGGGAVLGASVPCIRQRKQ